MKTAFQQSLILLSILLAVSYSRASDSLFEKRVPSSQGPRKLYDLMLESRVNPDALTSAMKYFDRYRSHFSNQRYLTLIDYSKKSADDRFYIFDLQTGKWERHLVAHGKGSGSAKSTRFSNKVGSGATSLGYYRTGGTYQGKHGLSLKLQGLSDSNSNAFKRAIVVHAAGRVRVRNKKVPYVSEDIVDAQGMLGRSLGCPALEPDVNARLIPKIKGGSLMYAFAHN